MSSVEERVKRVVSETLGVPYDDAHLDAKLTEDLGADSLDAIEIAMEIEDEFNVDVPDEVAESLHTVGDISRYVSSRITD